MSNAIEIKNLRKSYGEIFAVQDVTYSVSLGEMFGLIGPDGAGKTTTIKMLVGLVNPDLGDAELLGYNIKTQKNEIKNNVGYLSQRFSLYGDLTVDENIEFFAQIHKVKNFHREREKLLEFTKLKMFRDRLTEKLSGGMKQKLALACSLIHKPKIIFLDEPTTGVDPVSRRDLWKMLYILLSEGITIFLTTPYLDEAERCQRVAMMDKGKIICLGTPDQLKNSLDKKVIEIITSSARMAYILITQKSGLNTQLFGDRVNIISDNYSENLSDILSLLQEYKIPIEGLREVRPSIENVFIHLMDKNRVDHVQH